MKVILEAKVLVDVATT